MIGRADTLARSVQGAMQLHARLRPLRIDLLNRSSERRRCQPGGGWPPDAHESAREYWRIARALRGGTLVDDRVFDEVLFPLETRARSSVYWTPVEVAVRAANLLANKANATILDIGSGVGKFCIVAAATVNASTRGIEHRPHLIEIAREATAKIGVTATFDGGTIEEQDAAAIDGFYFFNPFAENLCRGLDCLDATVELSEARFRSDVDATEHLLARARVGARVVTYCGFGGEMPGGFVLASHERCGGGVLELWVKDQETPRRPPERSGSSRSLQRSISRSESRSVIDVASTWGRQPGLLDDANARPDEHVRRSW